MKIAVLEDNPAILEYLIIALELAGHQVEIHTQGTSLLDTLLTESGVRSPLPYDLLTVDLLLPGEVSGLGVIARIRQAIPSSQLPIIILSGAGHGIFEQATRDFPDIPIIRKPFQLKALLHLIEKLKPPEPPAVQ